MACVVTMSCKCNSNLVIILLLSLKDEDESIVTQLVREYVSLLQANEIRSPQEREVSA